MKPFIRGSRENHLRKSSQSLALLVNSGSVVVKCAAQESEHQVYILDLPRNHYVTLCFSNSIMLPVK